MSDAAESELEGEVSPGTAGGVIRYRVWPARRRPLTAVLAAAVVIGATGAAWYFESPLWSGIVFIGLTMTAGLIFFPTTVGLDGYSLNMRHLGTPRIWDLRQFRRLVVEKELVPHVDLLTRGGVSPIGRVERVRLPLPDDRAMSNRVLVHVRKWVGRMPTGRFELDEDHTPQDNV